MSALPSLTTTGCSKTRVQKSFFNFQFHEEADVLKTTFQCQIGTPISFAAVYSSNTCFLINCAVFEVNAQKSSKMKILDEPRLDMVKFFYSNGSSLTATVPTGSAKEVC
jgi:hypothetical protein